MSLRKELLIFVFIPVAVCAILIIALIQLPVTGPSRPCSDVMMKRMWGAGIACRAMEARDVKGEG